MKKLINFFEALDTEAKAALTPEVKKELCEDAKGVISKYLSGPWALLALSAVSELEKTIQ